MWKFLVALAILAAVVLVLARLRPPPDRMRFLQRAGLLLMATYTFAGAVWIAGEAFIDPGGWRAVTLVATWLVPLAVLLATAWYRVAWASVLLTALTVSVVGISIWYAVDPQAWQTFEDDSGPVRAITSFVLAAAIGLFGRRRPLLAGVLLVVLGVVPVALSTVGDVGRLGSLTAASLPPVLAGSLYLLAGVVGRSGTGTTAVPTTATRR